MNPLEGKESGGKLLPHSFLQGWVFLWEASCKKERERDILLGTWNVRSLYMAGSLRAATSLLARYKVDVVVVQEVRWDKGGPIQAGDYNSFYGKLNEFHQLEQDFCTLKDIISG
jgi:hypothetical protein